MKKAILPLILSLGLATQGLNGLETSLVKKNEKGSVNTSYFENAAMLIQNAYLIKEDIFTYTKPVLEAGGRELNPVANLFWEKNQWNLGYASAIGAQVLGNYLSYKIDKKGNLAKIVNGVISIAEIAAIKIGREVKNKVLGKQKFPYSDIKIDLFRISY